VALAAALIALDIGFLHHRARRRGLGVGGEGNRRNRRRGRVNLVRNGGLVPLGGCGLEVAEAARRIFRRRRPRGAGPIFKPSVIVAVAGLISVPSRGTIVSSSVTVSDLGVFFLYYYSSEYYVVHC
jgi:hypothetical protein